MALVLTNGIFYIAESDNGSIEKVEEESKARQFASVSKAIQFIKGGGNKTRHYHVCDTETNKICWQSQRRRKHYSPKVRKMIYDKADGRCALCGRKITLSEMTIDHIVPLYRKGEIAPIICSVHVMPVISLRLIFYRKISWNVSRQFFFIKWKRNITEKSSGRLYIGYWKT